MPSRRTPMRSIGFQIEFVLTFSGLTNSPSRPTPMLLRTVEIKQSRGALLLLSSFVQGIVNSIASTSATPSIYPIMSAEKPR